MKRMKTLTWIILSLLTLLTWACDDGPVFPVEPKIAFLDIQPREVIQLEDSILITFRFQDGDGNLGILNADNDGNSQPNLILIDSRFGEGRITEEQARNPYNLPSLTPDARNPSIQGEITIKLPPTVMIPPIARNYDSVRFQIKLYDRAGNLATPIDGSEQAVYTEYIRIVRN